MEVTFKTKEATFRLEASDMEDLIRQIAEIHVVFTPEPCAICGCTDTILTHRTPQGYDYYERTCTNPECGARLQFGIMRDSKRLFAKRTDSSGDPIGKNGWYIWKPQGDRNDEDTPKPRPTPKARQTGSLASAISDNPKEYYAELSPEGKAAVKSIPLAYREPFCKRAIALRVVEKDDLLQKAEVHRRLIAEYGFSPDEYAQVCSTVQGVEEETWAPMVKKGLPSKEKFMESLSSVYDPFVMASAVEDYDPFEAE